MASRIKGITVEIGGDTTDNTAYGDWYKTVYIPTDKEQEVN